MASYPTPFSCGFYHMVQDHSTNQSAETEYGDIYDCVNFYQQPAFDHPLLQNHTFHPQMKPTLPIMKEYSDESINGWPLGRSEGDGCPKGTVSIRRTTNDNLIRQKLMPPVEDVSFSTSFSYGNNLSNKVTFLPKGTSSLSFPYITYNPSNVLVDPTLYGDGRSKLYTYFQDLVNGNWWNLLTRNQTQIGFWPKQIFDELNEFASTIDWGRVVYSLPGILEPPMGSSFFPIGDTRYDAYCRNIGTIDDNGQETETGNLMPYMTNPDLYKVVDAPNDGSSFKHSVFYGGSSESTEV
ncbi:protein neprosin-like [Nicotiana tabacum]|uniref:Protein neprosin-like n=1 Tax=Nicotiana tabacum TaxID=4097 RepID=A0AC58SMX0_TOBAC